MSDDVRMDFADLISQVQGAIRISRLRDQRGKGADVAEVSLTLMAAVSKSADGQLRFTIPFINLEIGTATSHSDEHVQTIEMTFVPTPLKTSPRESVPAVTDDLVDGIVATRRSLRRAARGEVPLDLEDAAVKLDFVVNSKGEPALVAKAGSESKMDESGEAEATASVIQRLVSRGCLTLVHGASHGQATAISPAPQ